MTSASSAMVPRGTVCSTSGRSERPSPKKSVGARGLNLGWSAMSWRQPPRNAKQKTAPAQTRIFFSEALLIVHLGDVLRFQALQEPRGLRSEERRVGKER